MENNLELVNFVLLVCTPEYDINVEICQDSNEFKLISMTCVLIICTVIMKNKFVVKFEVLTALVLKSFILWDITPCSPLKVATFQRKISPPSSGAKNKPSKKPP
jgi:hypothetical protein